MSKKILFYVTGIGNSLAVAKSVATGMTGITIIPLLKESQQMK